MPAALGIDELRVEPHSPAGVLHAPLENIPHAQLVADLANVDRLVLVSESGAARDHKDTRTTREIGDQCFGDAVDEGIVLSLRRRC